MFTVIQMFACLTRFCDLDGKVYGEPLRVALASVRVAEHDLVVPSTSARRQTLSSHALPVFSRRLNGRGIECDRRAGVRHDRDVNKTTQYDNALFATDILEEAAATFEAGLPKDDRPLDLNVLAVRIGPDRWTFDSLDEFIAEHRKPHNSSEMKLWGKTAVRMLTVQESAHSTSVSITAPDRGSIVKQSAIFERKAAESLLPPPPAPPEPSPRVFIGHGRSQQWRDLKDHLHDLHGHDVEAYETGARAGHTIRDILQDMMTRSSFAVLVMTAEDEMADSDMRARQNVVHETGLMQGALGFSKAIVLVEAGTQDYSNLQGIHQIRYSAGNIKETYGEILATLRREFGAPR